MTQPAAQPAPIVREPGAGDRYVVLGDSVTIKASAAETGGALTFFTVETAPGAGPPLHVHLQEDEYFYVLEGEVEFQVGEQRVTARSGTFLFVPKNQPHTFANLSNRPSKMLVMTTPGGFDRFAAAADAMGRSGALNPEAVRELVERFAMKVVGPPLHTSTAQS